MTTAAQRINEFKKRGVAYSSSLVLKLSNAEGKSFYMIYAWIDQKDIDNKSLVLQGKYVGQDPDILFKEALEELCLRKIKLGVLAV